ncbi:MAG: cob(I)yrinic acid a,c-diamide adenosyltransferase [Chitinophagaceae bacterium]|nr:cob(I)yrinic acid a,c-diamide adenosyltransferase [Chitinophagaceae bacterium]
MPIKIYTKTGDAGKTSLLGGRRVSKGDLRIESYGSVDELNSFVGLLSDHQTDLYVKDILKEIQDRLFTIGSELATDPEKSARAPVPDLHESDIELLEKEIDRMNEDLPPLLNFILPGGAPAVSLAHVCRSTCRRAERNLIRLNDAEENVSALIIKYLNRLSDYFFELARYTSFKLDVPEVIWRARM